MVVLASGTEKCLDAIDGVLKQHAESFKLAEISSTMDGNSTLEYLIALGKEITPAELIATMRSQVGRHIIAAEIRGLKGRKTKAFK